MASTTADSNEKKSKDETGKQKEREVVPLEDVIAKVNKMTDSESKAFKYASDEHLEIVDVTWEDCARDKDSIWGYVLSQITLFLSACRL